MKRVEYLMEIYKLLVNLIYLLLSGIAFLIYNMFFVERDKIIIFSIFIGVGVFFVGILATIIKNINTQIVDNLKE